MFNQSEKAINEVLYIFLKNRHLKWSKRSSLNCPCKNRKECRVTKDACEVITLTHGASIISTGETMISLRKRAICSSGRPYGGVGCPYQLTGPSSFSRYPWPFTWLSKLPKTLVRSHMVAMVNHTCSSLRRLSEWAFWGSFCKALFQGSFPGFSLGFSSPLK